MGPTDTKQEISLASVKSEEEELLARLSSKISRRKGAIRRVEEEIEKGSRALGESISNLGDAEEFLKVTKAVLDSAKATASTSSRRRSTALFIEKSEESCKEAESEVNTARDHQAACMRRIELHKMKKEALAETLATYERYYQRVFTFVAQSGLPMSDTPDDSHMELHQKTVETGIDPNDDTLLRVSISKYHFYPGSARIGSDVLSCWIRSNGVAYLYQNGGDKSYNGKVELLYDAPRNQIEWLDPLNGTVPSGRRAIEGGHESGDAWYYAKRNSDGHPGLTGPNMVSVPLMILMHRLILLR